MLNTYGSQSSDYIFNKKPTHPDDLVMYRQARRKTTKPEILTQLSYHPNQSVSYAALLNPNIPVEQIVKHYGKRYYHKRKNECWVTSAISLNPSTPDTILEELWVTNMRSNPVVANTALYTMVKTTEQLNEALKDSKKANIVHTKYELYDDETIRIMLGMEQEWMRAKVAHIPNLDEKFLWELSKDKSYNVLIEIASRKNCPPDLLAKLGKNRSMRVKRVVSRNKNTEIEVLKTFLKYDSNYIKIGIVKHPKSTKDMIDVVLKSETTTESVKRHGVKRLKTFPEYEDYPMEWLEAMYGVKSK